MLDALRVRLKEQVKLTVSVMLLGGLDGVFNIVLSFTFVTVNLVNDLSVTVYVLVIHSTGYR